MRRTVDLSAHINQDVRRGHPADFPVALEPLHHGDPDSFRSIRPVPHRLAVVREDTGEAIGVVSDRYKLVPHQRILEIVEEAIEPLDAGPVPRGIYVDRGGARMRALFKFPALARPVAGTDEICPCLKIQNTYDGTARIGVQIGAFRFVSTNLAVGGGGVFAGGFMSIHAGEVPIEEVGRQLAAYLLGFETIVALYAAWSEQPIPAEVLEAILKPLPRRAAEAINKESAGARTVYDAYGAATRYATHECRSYRTAFDMLAAINAAFQEAFPAAREAPEPHLQLAGKP
ncbi:MAG TPA: DUF932 domain-containing protein [Candidatus Polarisedimenticolia bacterium]|nr:DUF932 domain-containing protein [Candidatus Polarisedimenticolia bacterium]